MSHRVAVRVVLVAALCGCSTSRTGDDANGGAGAGPSSNGSGGVAAGSAGRGGSGSEQVEHDAGTAEHDAGTTAESSRLLYSSADCMAVGALVLAAPIDADLRFDHCPDDLRLLGAIDDAAGGAARGQVCCLPMQVIKCAPPDIGG